MIRVETGHKDKNPSTSILENLPLSSSDLLPQKSDLDINSFTHPREIHFDHHYMSTDIQKFSLDSHGCFKCSPITSHFSDPRSNYDTLAEKSIKWVKHPHSTMRNPFPDLNSPYWEPKNVAVDHPDFRPRGSVRVSRIFENMDNKQSFQHIAKSATTSVLRNLKNRPLAVQELAYKIKQDIDNKLLIPLDDFLKKPDVIAQGFTPENISKFLISSAILLVYNPASTSSKVRLCVDPARQTASGQSINDVFKSGHPHIPDITNCLISSQFYVSLSLADISNFYTNCLLDSTGTLLSAVYLQAPNSNSKYPKLDPNDKSSPLKLHLYTGAKFGYRDAGSIACLSKTLLTKTYADNYPECIHKLTQQQLAKIKETLIHSYVDDLCIGVTLKDIQSELKNPTMTPSSNFGFENLSLYNQAEVLTIFETQKTLSVLDFNGFQAKKIKSSSKYVQNILNMDSRLDYKTSQHVDDRPNQDLLKKEILEQRKLVDFFANTNPDAYPVYHKDMFLYLGLAINKLTDKLSVKPRPLCLRKKLKGAQDISIRNLGELNTFLQKGMFTKSHLLALSHGLYCPSQSLTAVFNAVSKKLVREINISCPNITWQTKLDPEHHPNIAKVTELYFRTQYFSVDRFCLLMQPLEETRYYLIGFSDGALDFAASLVFVLSASRHDSKCKAQIISAATKLMSEEKNSEEVSIPKAETYAMFLCSIQLHKVAHLMHQAGIPIQRVILFSDAISSLLSLRRHPAIFKHPTRLWLASTNTNLYQIAQLVTSQQNVTLTKDDIPLWINQKERLNFADLLTKFHLQNDSVDKWVKHQETILKAEWLQEHPSGWLKQMIKESEYRISLQSLGGKGKNFTGEGVSDNDPTPIDAHFINFGSSTFPIISYPPRDMYIIDRIATDMPLKNPRCIFRVTGWIVFIFHRWLDKARARIHKQKLKGKKKCNCRTKLCKCVEHLFLDPARNRPFPLDYWPEIVSITIPKKNKWVQVKVFKQASDEQQNRVTIIGTLVATVICADTTMTPSLPKQLNNFHVTKVHWNDMFYYCMTGRKIRWTGYMQPSHHVIRQIFGDSPLMQHMIKSSHRLLGCTKGLEAYVSNIRMCGFNAVNLKESVKAYANTCKMCPLIRMGQTAKDPARILADRLTRGADDFVTQAISEDPLSTLQADEAGPILIGNTTIGYVKVWILVAVECVTRKIHLIPLKTTSTEQFLVSLEILQSRRGHITKLVVDNHTSHSGLQGKQDPVRSISKTLQNMVDGDGEGNLKRALHQRGIFIAVAESKRHSKVGLAEHAIYNLKQALFHLFPGTPQCMDLFEFSHRLSLIEMYLNERPVYTDHNAYITPYLWDISSLRRSQQTSHTNILTEQNFPCSSTIKDALFMISNDSKKLLTELAGDLAKRLLNFRNNSNLASNLQVDDFVYVPDRIQAKKQSTLIAALGRITSIKYPKLTIRMANKVTINRHCNHVVNFKMHKPDSLTCDILDLPLYGEPDRPTLGGSEFQLTIPEIIPVPDSQEIIHGVEPVFYVDDEIDKDEITMDE